MVHWSQSYKYGKAQEEKVIPELAAHFNKVVTPTTGQYAKYDCNDDDTNYEIKSRNNRMKAYPTTMITCNKFPKKDTQRVRSSSSTSLIVLLTSNMMLKSSAHTLPHLLAD